MAVIFNPKFLNQDQQVGKNKVDIEFLKSQVAYICNTQNELPENATSVLREETDVGNKPIENSLILSRNGNVFKIEATSEDETILYIRFYASLVGPQGPQGEQGESIVGPAGPQGPRGEAGESIVGPTGPQGPAGQNGTSAGFGTPTASVDSNTGTPSVTITSSGPDTSKVFDFAFHNLKGEQGIQGPQGDTVVGPRGPQGEPGQSIVGPQGPRGPKGDNGNSFVVTGSVVSVNDLPTASSTPTGTAYFVGGTYPRPVYVVVESEGVKIWQNEGTLQGPEGPQGIQGIPGANGNDGIDITFMGSWLNGQTYYYNDSVTYTENGVLSSYVMINQNAITSTTPPPQDPTNWQPSARGVQGPQGPAGQNGTNGTNGTNAGFGTPTASVDSNTGTPSVTITSSGPDTAKVFDFAFHNLKGEQGIQGPAGQNGTNGTNGTNAGFGTPTASVDSNVGTPSVTITSSGPDTAKVFNFAFHNLKGATGGTGPQGPEGPSGVVSVTTSGSGNNVTDISYNSSTKTITQTKSNCVTNIGGSSGSISADSLGNLILRSSTHGASSGVVTFRTGLSGDYAHLQIVWGRVSAGGSNDTSITFTRSFSVVPVVNVTWQKYDNTTREWNLKNDVSTTGFSMRKNSGDSNSYYEYIAIGWSSTASA